MHTPEAGKMSPDTATMDMLSVTSVEASEPGESQSNSAITDLITPIPVNNKFSVGFERGIRDPVIEFQLYPPSKLAFPSKFEPDDFPLSYRENSLKESRVIAYAENFSRQYSFLCRDRKPLFLTPLNELGVPKFVCSTIRRSKPPFVEFNEWSGCAEFVANFLNFIPLRPCNEPPEKLFSPKTIMDLQMGTVFDYANLLCCFLLGSGYDAYVVHGYASAQVCLCNQRTTSKEEPAKQSTPVKTPANTETKKYCVKPLREMVSRFEVSQQAVMLKHEQDRKDKKLAAKRKQEKLLDKPKKDLLFGLRVHAWILVQNGKREVPEPFFIEPLIGEAVDIRNKAYLGIEAVWNDQNYWVNMQDCSNGIGEMQYNLNDPLYWEYLMPTGSLHGKVVPPGGEPGAKGRSPSLKNLQTTLDYAYETNDTDDLQGIDITKPNSKGMVKMVRDGPSRPLRQRLEADVVDKALLIDLPPSWTVAIELSNSDKSKKYPNSTKQRYYKRMIENCYQECSRSDGMVKEIEHFEDRNYTVPIKKIQVFKHRGDKLEKITNDMKEGTIVEEFGKGFLDSHLKLHSYTYKATAPKKMRHMEFYWEARVDGLVSRTVTDDKMSEHFKDRPDRLVFRETKYLPNQRPGDGHVKFSLGDSETGGEMKEVERIVEHYDRNPDLDADDDVRELSYLLLEEKITLEFHVADDCIFASRCEFSKSAPSDERKAEKLHDETYTAFTVDPYKEPRSRVEINEMLVGLSKSEKASQSEVCRAESENWRICNLRKQQMQKCELETGLFDTLRLHDARQTRINMERAAIEEKNRVVETELDYLEPFLSKLRLTSNELNKEEAYALREECLRDFRNHLVMKANIIQSRFEAETEELRRKQQYYQVNQKSVKKKDEEEYLQYCKDAMFRIHTLETILTRHKELAPHAYMALEKKLRSDKRIERFLN